MDREHLLADFFERMNSMRRLFIELGAGTKVPTRAQFAVLAMLEHNNKSIKELAIVFGMTSSAITQVVNGLTKARLLTRKTDPSDRRKISLTLTKNGHKVLMTAKKKRRAAMSKILAPLSDNEIRQLRDIQEKIIAHLPRV